MKYFVIFIVHFLFLWGCSGSDYVSSRYTIDEEYLSIFSWPENSEWDKQVLKITLDQDNIQNRIDSLNTWFEEKDSTFFKQEMRKFLRMLTVEDSLLRQQLLFGGLDRKKSR